MHQPRVTIVEDMTISWETAIIICLLPLLFSVHLFPITMVLSTILFHCQSALLLAE